MMGQLLYAALQRKISAMFAMLENHGLKKDVYDDGSLLLDFSGMTAALNGREISLSTLEYKMLDLLSKNAGHVLTRGQLLEKLWDVEERYVDEHTLTTTVSTFGPRLKLTAHGFKGMEAGDQDKQIDRDARHLYAVLSGYTDR